MGLPAAFVHAGASAAAPLPSPAQPPPSALRTWLDLCCIGSEALFIRAFSHNKEELMLQTVEAVIERDGQVRLLEPLSLPESRRAIVTVLPDPADEAGAGATALLSEAALSDWNREEEDAAWAHLQ
jgi:hypothetical protein